tara:strand:- start:602 stop:1240 length:639 start_codon:yes stop_codon:yes gene_type:complete
MSYIPKDAVTQAFRSNKGVLTPNQIIELDNENKFTKYGQLELLLTNASISSASTVDFTGLDTYGNFDVFFLTFNDLTIANDNKRIGLELLSNGTASGTSYHAAASVMETDGTFTATKSTSLPGLRITDNIGSATNENANGYIHIYNALDSQKFTNITYHSTFVNSSGVAGFEFGSGVHPLSRFDNGLRFHPDINGSSTFTGGSFSLYGIRNY